MTIINQAAHTIMEAEYRIQGHTDDLAADRAREYAQALKEASLLAPEPPETLTPATHPEWAQDYYDEWECCPEVEWQAGKDFFINRHENYFNAGFGLPQEEWLNLTPQELREIAAALLAAANHAEKEQA